MTSRVQEAVQRQKSRWRRIAPAGWAFLDLAMFFLVAAACAAGVWFLWQKALGDPRFRMEGETLALAGAVRECPESVAELERLGKSFAGRSLLEPGLIGDMEKTYGECVWIKKITKLRRRFPNRMDVEFLLRMPAAQVWHDNRYWLIDLDATVLPVAGTPDLFPNLPEIVGVTPNVIARRPNAGGAWTDEGVLGALGIIRAFWGSPLAEALPVVRVVVNNGAMRDNPPVQDIRRRFEVVTDQGAVVRWGTFNPGELPGELTSSQKLWYLQELLKGEESLAPGVCFDVRTRLPGYTILR